MTNKIGFKKYQTVSKFKKKHFLPKNLESLGLAFRNRFVMRRLNKKNFKAIINIINTGCVGQNIRDKVRYFVDVTTHAQLFALKN